MEVLLSMKQLIGGLVQCQKTFLLKRGTRKGGREGIIVLDSKEKMTMPPQNRSEYDNDEMDKEAWQCMNSMDQWSKRRRVLENTLRQPSRISKSKWPCYLNNRAEFRKMQFKRLKLEYLAAGMISSVSESIAQLVSARYEMGPGRISEPLFSLKPQASQTVLKLSAQEADKEGLVVFDLVRTTARKGQPDSAEPENNDPSHQNSNVESGLRRRPVFSSAENKDGLEDIQLHEDPDRELMQKTVEVQKNSLQGFGALVSPHLRSAQNTFFKALQLAVDLVNLQSDALDARDKYLRLAANMPNN